MSYVGQWEAAAIAAGAQILPRLPTLFGGGENQPGMPCPSGVVPLSQIPASAIPNWDWGANEQAKAERAVDPTSGSIWRKDASGIGCQPDGAFLPYQVAAIQAWLGLGGTASVLTAGLFPALPGGWWLWAAGGLLLVTVLVVAGRPTRAQRPPTRGGR